MVMIKKCVSFNDVITIATVFRWIYEVVGKELASFNAVQMPVTISWIPKNVWNVGSLHYN